MDKAGLLEALKALVSQEDALAVARDVNDLRGQFEDLILEEDRQFQVSQLEAQEKGEEVPEKQADPIRQEFYELVTAYRERRNEQQRLKKESEEANLRKKKSLLEQLKELVSGEENIAAAMAAYKEIHEAWKGVGDIPREKRQDMQSEYSKLLETFFYHIKIYRELRDHDFKRNHQLKEAVIQKVQELSNMEQIKDVEQALKLLQNEWEEIGPVLNEDWEDLKNRYWDAVRAAYTRIQAFYEDRRKELTENLELKKELVLKAASMVKELAINTPKDWDVATQQLLALQEQWKAIGFGPRKENEEVWKEFRANCDAFFEAKKAFFDDIRKKYDDVAQAKQALVERVHDLKGSTDWKDTTMRILAIQKEWKNLGNAGHRFEQKLWKDFRSACDHFFDAKQAFYAEQDAALEGNLESKKALIERIKSAELPTEKRDALTMLRGFSAEFTEIGKVPMKEKDAIYQAYREALDAHYKKLKLEGDEQERVMFQAKLDNLRSSANPDKAMARERAELHEKISQLRSDILQYENNLGFFAKSKGADSLRKEVESKIMAAKRRIEELQQKLKLLTA
ncbi:MAG: DUF349 domain-containing protein [Fluviicola sp.]